MALYTPRSLANLQHFCDICGEHNIRNSNLIKKTMIIPAVHNNYAECKQYLDHLGVKNRVALDLELQVNTLIVKQLAVSKWQNVMHAYNHLVDTISYVDTNSAQTRFIYAAIGSPATKKIRKLSKFCFITDLTVAPERLLQYVITHIIHIVKQPVIDNSVLYRLSMKELVRYKLLNTLYQWLNDNHILYTVNPNGVEIINPNWVLAKYQSILAIDVKTLTADQKEYLNAHGIWDTNNIKTLFCHQMDGYIAERMEALIAGDEVNEQRLADKIAKALIGY